MCSVILSLVAPLPHVHLFSLPCSRIFVLCPMAVSPGPAGVLASLVYTVAGSPFLCPVLILVYYLYKAQVFLLMWP